MKIFYVFLVLWGVATGCGNDFYHDSGLADGKHDCTVWEYLQTERIRSLNRSLFSLPRTCQSINFCLKRLVKQEIWFTLP